MSSHDVIRGFTDINGRMESCKLFATNKLKTWWKYHLLYCEGAGFSRTVALVGEDNFGSVPYPQLQGCLYHLLHRFSYIPVAGKTTENESVSPCDSLLFTKWFVSNHQNPNSWTLMVSKRKKLWWAEISCLGGGHCEQKNCYEVKLFHCWFYD